MGVRPEMKLTDEEQALRAGEFGAAAQWAIEHQIIVGRIGGTTRRSWRSAC
jgi:hypothetical protein